MPPPSRPLRVQSPIREKSAQLDNSDSEAALNETTLVQAIQTLDATWRRMRVDIMGSKQINSSIQLSDALREALCIFLEIVSSFNKAELICKSTYKAKLETVCTARMLGCLRRFVSGCFGSQQSFGECCKRKCEQRLIHITLLSILFCMCREPDIACNVVKENLHDFLIKMCVGGEMPNDDMSLQRPVADYQDEVSFDPHDLMITIDPFDWCYQSLCTRLLKENKTEFFLPIGIRPIICLLRGHAIPTDEVMEFEQRSHKNKGFSDKSPRHRKLPSIFKFPQSDTGDCLEEDRVSTRYRLAPLCIETRSIEPEHSETRALWTAVMHHGSIIHLAVRSLIALGIHLPRPSSEFKVLARNREYIRRGFRTILSLSSHNVEKSQAWLHVFDSAIPQMEILPIYAVATQVSTLKRLACSALSLFAEERKTASVPRQQVSPGSKKTLSPIKKKGDLTKGGEKRRDCELLSLQARLKSATKAANFEFEAEHTQGLDINQNRRRLEIRKMCADVESLRTHLVGSLAVLCSGRRHPDPQQTFSEWIKSLPTLDTLERERQYQLEMRQRQILEQQYQREAVRRRERDESTLMHANDYNVPEENELSVQQEKHEQILRMQAEIRQLEQRDLHDSPKVKSIAAQDLSKKENLAMQERGRLLQLEDQRREGRELEKMRREDLYYVERILQAKAKAKEEQEQREKAGALQKSAIEEQQRYIARMRLLDEEKRVAERETIGMRVEDLHSRQRRTREAEKAKEELQNEWHERKAMQAEEHDCRLRWVLWDRMLAKQQQEELKLRRAEARRLKRQQQRHEKDIRAAWIESWDENGNRYFYNSVTGTSQWDPPTLSQLVSDQ